MSKTWLGLLIGTIAGAIDGLSAWFTPEARSLMMTIVIGSTTKGFITGLVAGWVAQRSNSLVRALVAGLIVGLALSYLAAQLTPDPAGHHYYVEIMLPGAFVGLIAGFASQRFGSQPLGSASRRTRSDP